jgi:hypothetical protein
MAYSATGGIFGNPSGTLQFAGPGGKAGDGLYFITWNGIPAIDLGGSPIFPEDLGFGLIHCDAGLPVDPDAQTVCAHGDSFQVTYDAHVPKGDPSGFGGVLYTLRSEGTVAFLDGRLQTSAGALSGVLRQPSSAVTADAGFEPNCIGDCIDYVVTGLTAGDIVSVVVPLAGGVPGPVKDNDGNTVPPELRVLNGATWGSFTIDASNTVKSAPWVDGGAFGKVCPPPGGAYTAPMTEGDQCLEITTQEGGPNDKDTDPNTITDPSGLGLPKIIFVDKRTSSSDSGCSMTTKEIDPSHRGEWWLLAGFLGWLGWKRRKTRQH